MKVTIGKYEYESIGTECPIENFFLQKNGGSEEGNPIIRKLIKGCSISEMYTIYEKFGYYPINKLNPLYLPLTWTNNPEIIKQDLHQKRIKTNTQL